MGYKSKIYGERSTKMGDFRRDFPLNGELKLVATGGCFDLLSATHVQFLFNASTLGDRLLVLVNSDESVKALKGAGRPIIPLRQRCEMVAALEFVDAVMTFDQETPCEALDAIKTELWVKSGYSWDDMPELEVVEDPRNGGMCVSLAPQEGESATELIARIRVRKVGE